MKIKILLIFVFTSLSIFLFNSNANSQITLQAGVGGGIVSPQADYAGSTAEFYSGKNYGLSSGYNLSGKARVGLLGLNVFAQIDYFSFSNSGESESGKGKVELNQKVISIKAGPEFQINLPLIPIKPYLNASISYNTFSGETIFNGVAKVPSGTHNLNSASRFGLGVGGGVAYKINPILSIDLGIQYSMMNLFGKVWEDVNPNKDQRLDSYLSLNDEKDPLSNLANDDHFISSSRAINSISITATLMFGL